MLRKIQFRGRGADFLGISCLLHPLDTRCIIREVGAGVIWEILFFTCVCRWGRVHRLQP